MNWTISKKMFVMGLGVVIVMAIVGGISYWSNLFIQGKTDETELRNQHLELAVHISDATLELILAAMDAIIDKDAGKIAEERMQLINDNIAFIESQQLDLQQAVDTDQEKEAARKIQEEFPKLTKSIREELVSLIEESTHHLQEIENAFIQIDDELDVSAEQIEKDLGKIFASVQAEQ